MALALIGALDGLEATLALIASGSGIGIRIGDPDADRRSRTRPIATMQRRAGRAPATICGSCCAPTMRTSSTTSKRAARGFFLRASPIDVSRIVREALFDRYRTVVLTSATLAVDGSFAYVKGRLGLRDADEIRVPSEFDFRRQALLYLPRQMPPPKSPSFAEAVAREAIALVTHSQGRAFVLFTSYKVLHAVRPFIEMALPYPVLVQGIGAALGADRRVPIGRRMPSCWPRPASGRAWTSSATRSAAW